MSSPNNSIDININSISTTYEQEGDDSPKTLSGSKAIAEKFFSLKKTGSTMMPPVIRGFTDNFTWIMFERPAKRIKVNTDSDEIEVAIPWTIWVMHLSNGGIKLKDLYVYARSEVTITPDAMLFHLPWPGVAEDGKTLMADDIKFNKYNDIQSKIGLVLGAWQSRGVDKDDEYYDNLKVYSDHSEFSVLDMEYLPAKPPKVLMNWHQKTNDKGLHVLTVGDWINFFQDNSATDDLEATPTPVLDFIKDLSGK